jgi:hypothetical protein
MMLNALKAFWKLYNFRLTFLEIIFLFHFKLNKLDLNLNIKHMARIDNGIMGAFHGIVGKIEGYTRKGQAIIRARRRPVTKTSLAQHACRQSMKVVNEFTHPITNYVRMGFELEAAPTTKTANNLAKSYQLLHGLKGEYPNIEIDYPKVRVTSGDAGADVKSNSDQVLLLVYYPDRKEATQTYARAKRSEMKETLQIPRLKPGERIETYISFISATRKKISNSVYVGAITTKAPVAEAPITTEKETPKQPRFSYKAQDNEILVNYSRPKAKKKDPHLDTTRRKKRKQPRSGISGIDFIKPGLKE